MESAGSVTPLLHLECFEVGCAKTGCAAARVQGVKVPGDRKGMTMSGRNVGTFDRKLRELSVFLRGGDPKVEWENVPDGALVTLFPEETSLILSLLEGNGVLKDDGIAAPIHIWTAVYRRYFQMRHLQAALDTAQTRAWGKLFPNKSHRRSRSSEPDLRPKNPHHVMGAW